MALHPWTASRYKQIYSLWYKSSGCCRYAVCNKAVSRARRATACRAQMVCGTAQFGRLWHSSVLGDWCNHTIETQYLLRSGSSSSCGDIVELLVSYSSFY